MAPATEGEHVEAIARSDSPSVYEAGIPRITARVRRSIGERGLAATGFALADWAVRYATGLPGTARSQRRTFSFNHRDYEYTVHRHKHTWLSERAVEIPIAKALLDDHAGARVLEVGNVLAHYIEAGHPVVDKYERAPGVVNVDVLDLAPTEPLDLILSVSTLEHVGWDDTPRDPARAVHAVAHLKGLLAPDGLLLATVPVGYNPHLVDAIRCGRAGFDEVAAMVRVGRGMRWREVPVDTAWDLPYDRLLYRAPAVLVCFARGRSATMHP